MIQLIRLLLSLTLLGSIILICRGQTTLKATTLPRPNECGVGSDRLLGGSLPFLADYPWTALIQYRKPDGELMFGCGGSLINSRYVLTAAHCLRGIPNHWKIIGVRLGERDLSKNPDCEEDLCADPPVDMAIDKLIVHEDHNNEPRTQWDDIALIRFDRDVTFSEYISPVCLPLDADVRSSNTTGLRVTEVGWSRTVGSRLSDNRVRSELEIVDRSVCETVYEQLGSTLRNTQFCVSKPKPDDVCHGIAGSSLMQRIDGNHYLVGFSSFGPSGCDRKDVPDVYTNVTSYIDWIRSKLE